MDAKGLLRKRAPFTSHCRAANKGKVCGYRLPFPSAPVAGTSLEALCQVLGQCPSLGARTGRALQNGLHTGREQASVCAIGKEPSAWGDRRLCHRREGRASARPPPSSRFIWGKWRLAASKSQRASRPLRLRQSTTVSASPAARPCLPYRFNPGRPRGGSRG